MFSKVAFPMPVVCTRKSFQLASEQVQTYGMTQLQVVSLHSDGCWVNGVFLDSQILIRTLAIQDPLIQPTFTPDGEYFVGASESVEGFVMAGKERVPPQLLSTP